MPNITEGVEMGAAARIWSLPDADIGGAFVRRGFTRFTKDSPGGQYLKAGTKLTADEVRSIPMTNRRALAVSGALDIYPVAPGQAAPPEDLDRFVIHAGGGRYDVVLGKKLNDAPLTKQEAEALAEAD
jgi:hypothetical protein